MNLIKTDIPDVLVIEPDVFSDERGFFYESYNKLRFEEMTGVKCDFVQDNHSLSSKGVLRGLHYQIGKPQAKLVRVTRGEIFDVAVDLRKSSPRFGEWVGFSLSAANNRQMWIPEGFAHGFLVLSDIAEVQYKASDYYAPECERCIKWDDAELDIGWPCDTNPVVSDKDASGKAFSSADVFE